MILRAKDKLVVGLTGSILSGKSTALSYFARYGAGTVSADELVRELYQTPAVRKKLLAWFGSAEPAEVARRVFADEEGRRRLEACLHPKVLALAAKRVKSCANTVVVVEVPLLFEAGWDRLTDLNVVVLGNRRTLAKRLRARGITCAEYKRRLETQLPEKEKALRADIILANRGNKTDLGLKVKRLCRAFEYIYGAK